VTPLLTVAGAFKQNLMQITLQVSHWQFNCQSVGTVPDFCQPYHWWKWWHLVSRRNVSSEEAAVVRGSGRPDMVWCMLICISQLTQNSVMCYVR